MSKNKYSSVHNKDPEINILLLAETGAGKSTTISALANYLMFASFEDATEKLEQLSVVCPVQFTLPDPVTREMLTVKMGNDDHNERFENADSVTQAPVGYQFGIPGIVVQIIDTPGMGDTRGSENDKENFEKIICFLQHYQHLNAVILLVKGNDSRKTTHFKYCITELLNNLHASITANIMFCFTYSHNTMYGPGEGFKTMQELLAGELKSSGLKMNLDQNCFFVDNEAFRYLVAKKQGYQFKPEYSSFFRLSWENSAEQMERMFMAIQKLPVHNLNKTTSLFSAKKLINELAQPMVQLQKNIQHNIKSIELQEEELRNSKKSKLELAQSLHIEVQDLEMREISKPSTVCTERRCIELVKTSDHQEKIHYKTRCHEGCKCIWVTPNVTNQWMLYFCEAFSWNGDCRKCGCNIDKHMHIAWEYLFNKRTVIDPNVAAEIHNKKDAIAHIQETLKKTQQLVTEYKVELQTIQNINAKFACLLSTDSCLSHNQFFDQYLDLLISEERKKENPQTENLVEMKRKHKEEVRMLMDAMKNKSQEKIQVEDVPKYHAELLQLKHCGPMFKQMLEKAKSIRESNPPIIKRIPIASINKLVSKLISFWN